MNVSVVAGQTDIVISASDMSPNQDTIQVIIVNSLDVVVYNDVFESQFPRDIFPLDYSVDNGTYSLTVYWNNGANSERFDGITVPANPSNFAVLPTKRFGPPPLTHPPAPVPNPKKRPAPHAH